MFNESMEPNSRRSFTLFAGPKFEAFVFAREFIPAAVAHVGR
jgi:hypothetical protein